MIEEIDDDALLVAYIDDQLDQSARAALRTRLVVEPLLRARFERLAAGGLPFDRAFEALLAEAPVEKLSSRLQASVGGQAPPARRTAKTWRAVAVGLCALALLFMGWGLARLYPASSESDDDWRRSVADYVSLYTAETFAHPPDAATSRAALDQLSETLGLPLSPASIALPNLTFRRADLLTYDGAPLGQIAYIDADGPIVFCIIRNDEKDAPVKTEKHEDLVIASWAHGRRGYLVAGRTSRERIAALAETLSARF
jgi:anti-sigma factor RsiW